jgi:type II secretory pathway component PulC
LEAGRLSTWRSAIENPQPLVLAICILAFAALIGIELWSAAAAQLTPADSQPRAATNPQRDQSGVDQITAADLFGHATNQNANLPETTLQLTLRAVFAASDPHAASAVIEASDGHAQMVKVGAGVGGAATLQEVYANRVVLARNGVLETLYFPAPQESTEMTVAQNTQAPGDTAETPDSTANNAPAGASAEEIKRAAILQRLEELRARSSR